MKWHTEKDNVEFCLYAESDIGTFYIYNSPIFPKYTLYIGNTFLGHESSIGSAKAAAAEYLLVC